MAAKQPEPEQGERPLLGHFVDVIDGPHKGLFAAYLSDVDKDTILVRNRDHEKGVDMVPVLREHCRLSARNGGR